MFTYFNHTATWDTDQKLIDSVSREDRYGNQKENGVIQQIVDRRYKRTMCFTEMTVILFFVSVSVVNNFGFLPGMIQNISYMLISSNNITPQTSLGSRSWLNRYGYLLNNLLLLDNIKFLELLFTLMANE